MVEGNRGDKWIRTIKDISALNLALNPGEKMQIQFIGIVGTGVKSDSAIDDVRLHKSTCANVCDEGMFTCDAELNFGDGKCISWTNVCDGNADCINKRKGYFFEHLL